MPALNVMRGNYAENCSARVWSVCNTLLALRLLSGQTQTFLRSSFVVDSALYYEDTCAPAFCQAETAKMFTIEHGARYAARCRVGG
jgi:hypothetical protein